MANRAERPVFRRKLSEFESADEILVWMAEHEVVGDGFTKQIQDCWACREKNPSLDYRMQIKVNKSGPRFVVRREGMKQVEKDD
jgi:hypothetical protein